MFNLVNLPYCFLFVPLILSCFSALQNYKITNIFLNILSIFSILFLACYLLPDTLPNNILSNAINHNLLFIGGEYKINSINLIFIILIFLVKLLSFILFDEKIIKTKKLNLFFSIYLINYFAICGILTSNNIFNIYLFMELYSFSLYNIMSDYNVENYNKVAFKYYNNAVLSSIFFMFFVFIVYFTFGTADIDLIKKSLPIISNSYLYNLSVVVFLFSILFKFFSFNFYFTGVLQAKNLSNSIFINVLFGDILLGIYILWKFLFSVFDEYLIFNVFYLKYLFYMIGSYLIIYSSYFVFKRESLMSISYTFCLIMLGYVLILLGLNNNYKDISIILFLINHCLINFLFFAIALFCVSIFKKPSNGFLYVFYKYRFIIYALILSKLLFPISFGFDCYWNFMLSIVQNKEYYLFIPLIFEKIIMVFLFTKYCFIFAREHKEEYMYINLEKKISIKNNNIILICILLSIIVLATIFQNSIINVLSDFNFNKGNLL